MHLDALLLEPSVYDLLSHCYATLDNAATYPAVPRTTHSERSQYFARLFRMPKFHCEMEGAEAFQDLRILTDTDVSV